MDNTNIDNVSPEVRARETVKIGISGMTCDHCVRKVEKALRGLPGVQEVNVDQSQAMAQVTFDRSEIDVPAMHDALLKSGYRPVPVPAS